MLLRCYLFACLSLAAIGCSAPGPEAGSDVKVTGGQRVSGSKWPTAVALTRDGNPSCTATLVAPNLVITAAHCLEDGPAVASLAIVVGNAIRGGQAHRVASYNINPRYRNTAQTDFAYVKLQDEVKDIQFVQVLTNPDEIQTLLRPGTESTLVGFGWSIDDDAGEIGTKYEATSHIGRDQAGALFIGGDGADTCQGDSGGPAFGRLANGQLRVYGITSRGATCHSGGTYARMSDGLCWIQQDSGIAVPGSELKCQGVVNIPALDATTPTLSGKDLHLLLGVEKAGTPDAYDLYIGAEKTTAKVSLCFGDKAACISSRKEDMTFSKVKDTADQILFHATTALQLVADLKATLLGFDSAGKLVQASGIQLKHN